MKAWHIIVLAAVGVVLIWFVMRRRSAVGATGPGATAQILAPPVAAGVGVAIGASLPPVSPSQGGGGGVCDKYGAIGGAAAGTALGGAGLGTAIGGALGPVACTAGGKAVGYAYTGAKKVGGAVLSGAKKVASKLKFW